MCWTRPCPTPCTTPVRAPTWAAWHGLGLQGPRRRRARRGARHGTQPAATHLPLLRLPPPAFWPPAGIYGLILIATTITVSITIPLFSAMAGALFLVSGLMLALYLPAATHLKKLRMGTAGDLVTLIAESLDGLPVIQAFAKQVRPERRVVCWPAVRADPWLASSLGPPCLPSHRLLPPTTAAELTTPLRRPPTLNLAGLLHARHLQARG